MSFGRALLNALSPIDLDCAQYWNVLAQDSTVPYSPQLRLRDYAAQLEVKQRAWAYVRGSAALPAVVLYPNRFVDASFHASAYSKLRKEFKNLNFCSGSQEALLYALERVVADGQFTYAGSRDLAERTLKGAKALLPITFSSSHWGKCLRDKPYYLAP